MYRDKYVDIIMCEIIISCGGTLSYLKLRSKSTVYDKTVKGETFAVSVVFAQSRKFFRQIFH